LVKAGIDVVGISGNHDAADPDWLDVLGIHNLTRAPYDMGDGCLMFGHNYMIPHELAIYLEQVHTKEWTFLVLHQTFDKIAPHPSAQDFTISDLPSHRIVLSGHVHQLFLQTDPVKDTTVCYSGNTEYWRLGEDVTKSVALWTDMSCQMLTLPTRPVLDYTLTDDNTSQLNDEIQATGTLPIVILRYGTHLGKKVRELQKSLYGHVLALKLVPMREEDMHMKVKPGVRMDSHTGIVDNFLTTGTPENKLARTLLSSQNEIEADIAGFRSQFLTGEHNDTK